MRVIYERWGCFSAFARERGKVEKPVYSVGIIEDEEQSLKLLANGLSRYEEETGVQFKVIHFRDAELFLSNSRKVVFSCRWLLRLVASQPLQRNG